MNTEMARATLDDRKTQTRRVVKRFYDLSLHDFRKHPLSYMDMPKDLEFKELQGYGRSCPLFYSKSENKYYCGENLKYIVGEKVWVREPVAIENHLMDRIYCWYKADHSQFEMEIPKRFKDPVPKWILERFSVPNGCIKEMARIFLVNTGVKIERLQNITYEDMQKEGYSEVAMNSAGGLNWFKRVWNETTQKGYEWNDNPFVYVYDFKRTTR